MKITYSNFFKSTFAVFKECKPPKRMPDFISKDNEGNVSSSYWYGENNKGEYVIRESDHWSYSECKNIASCWWQLRIVNNISNAGKAYLKDFKGRS